MRHQIKWFSCQVFLYLFLGNGVVLGQVKMPSSPYATEHKLPISTSQRVIQPSLQISPGSHYPSVPLSIPHGWSSCGRMPWTSGRSTGPCPKLPHGALPLPNGSYVRQWNQVMATLAEHDDFVIYRQEWLKDSPKLGRYGEYHLGQILKRLPQTPFTVVVEPTGVKPLDLQRRLVIVNALASARIPNAEMRVIIALPKAEGLRAEEGIPIYSQTFGIGNQGGGIGQRFGSFGRPTGGFGSFGSFGGFGGFGPGRRRSSFGGFRGSFNNIPGY